MVESVVPAVSLNLCFPERRESVLPVPEVAVDKYDEPCLREDEIGPGRKRHYIGFVLEAEAVEFRPDRDLDLTVEAPDPGHAVAALGWGQAVCHDANGSSVVAEMAADDRSTSPAALHCPLG